MLATLSWPWWTEMKRTVGVVACWMCLAVVVGCGPSDAPTEARVVTTTEGTGMPLLGPGHDARFEPARESSDPAVPESVVPTAPAAPLRVEAAPVADARPAPVTVAPSRPAAVDINTDFIDYVAAHCYVDRFANDHFKQEYFQALGEAPLTDEDDPEGLIEVPLPPTPPRPMPGDAGYGEYVEGLRREWIAQPRSRVVDCELHLEARSCERCEHSSRQSFRYGLYLPARYFEDPTAIRTVLLLVPGGKGGRTRWFLEPVPYKVNKKRLSQGLSLQSRLDTYLADNPDLDPPIVVTMDDPGQGYTNGIYEYLRTDLIQHVLGVYLPGRERADIAFGVDAISSGSRNAATALIQDPYAFDTFGWMCTHCHPTGFAPERYFGWPNSPGDRALAVWAERAAKGELHMKMSIGKRDRFIGCNREVHELLLDAGVIARTHEPYHTRCPEGVDPTRKLSREEQQQCVTIKPGLTEYPGIGHSYELMPAAFGEHLNWHIAKLTEVARARGLR